MMSRCIKRLYGRNYLSLITCDSTLSLGDILERKRDICARVDSSVFSPHSTEFVEGKKENRNITSGSKVNLKTKVSGEAILLEHFKLAEAGLAIEFSKSNQMFLKVVGIRQQSLKNFIDFKKEVLEKYTVGDLSPKFFIVSGVVVADKFYLRYSGKNGGTVGLNVKPNLPAGETELSGDFSIKWEKDVGYGVDGASGGVLAYRVSAVRFNREKLPRSIQQEILNGKSEMTILEELSNADRKKVVHDGILDVPDLTEELLNEELAIGNDPDPNQGDAMLHEEDHEMVHP